MFTHPALEVVFKKEKMKDRNRKVIGQVPSVKRERAVSPPAPGAH